jgi:transposase-like protein
MTDVTSDTEAGEAAVGATSAVDDGLGAEWGPVEIAVPRDRAGSFEPQLVKKRQRRLGGVDEMVLSLSAKRLTHGEISAHLAEVYGAEIYLTVRTRNRGARRLVPRLR